MGATVSIAMCSYNGARFIGAQLASLAGQTLQPFEVIICDDGSSDGTGQVVADFARAAPFPVRFVQNAERQGYRRNFMQAASLCSGDLVAFCDQDDIWRADKLHKVAQAFANSQVILVHHNARLVDADGRPLGTVNQQASYPSFNFPLIENPWRYALGFTQSFRRELNAFGDLREEILGNAEREWTAHDQWIFFLGNALGSVVYLEEELVDYRQHGANTYGLVQGGARVSPLASFIGKIGAYRDYKLLRIVCDRRLQVLRTVIDRTEEGGLLHSNAIGAVAFYERLERLYARRAEIYSATRTSARWRAWRKMAADGGYSDRRTPSFRKISRTRDLVQGVVLAKLKAADGPSAVDMSLNPRDPQREPSVS